MNSSNDEDEKFQTASPIKLNCWKHHLGFIKKQLPKLKPQSEKNLTESLLQIGSSQMDLYLGEISPIKISEQIKSILKKNNIQNYTDFNLWLTQKHKQYYKYTLSDKSIWVLRKGVDAGRFVHIHPGRYSPHTIRVKSHTLKTAILFCASGDDQTKKIETAEEINYLRKKYLMAPPLKDINKSTSLLNLIKLLKE